MFTEIIPEIKHRLTPPQHQAGGSNAVLLIVDDNEVSARLVQMIVRKKGYAAMIAKNGSAGLEMAKNRKPDLILLDIEMPGMSGIDVCKILKHDEKTRVIPIIFVTAYTDDKTVEAAFDAGGTDYIKKPIRSLELIARIESALAQIKLIEKTIQEAKLKGVIEMAGAVCHEMNQPMQVVSGVAELLLLDMKPTDPNYENLAMLFEQAGRMGEITKKFMNITKYETKDYLKSKIVDIDRASLEAG